MNAIDELRKKENLSMLEALILESDEAVGDNHIAEEAAEELAAMQAVVAAAQKAKDELEAYYKIKNNGQGYIAAYNFLSLPLRELSDLKGRQE